MLSQKIQQELLKSGKQAWLCKGSQLSPTLKSILRDHKFSLRIYTKVLFNDADIRHSQLIALCNILEIDIKNII
jgi:hypothetical protein